MKTHQRREYYSHEISKKYLDSCPIQQFKKHYRLACDNCSTPNAMILSTDSEGMPDSRVVLLKEIDRGFIFFTNKHSPKIEQIKHSQQVCILFYWKNINIQIRIQGKASFTEKDMADIYFSKRDRNSQINSHASPQSQVIDETYMSHKISDTTKLYTGQEIPSPDHWVGVRIVPEKMEFWYGKPDRNHLRFLYKLSQDNWSIEQLAP